MPVTYTRIIGTCRNDSQQPIARRVVAWREDTGAKVAETTSNAETGEFRLFDLDASSRHIVGMIPEPTDARKAPRFGGVLPALVPVLDDNEGIVLRARQALKAHNTGSPLPLIEPEWAEGDGGYPWLVYSGTNWVQLNFVKESVASAFNLQFQGTPNILQWNGTGGNGPDGAPYAVFASDVRNAILVSFAWLQAHPEFGAMT